MTETHELVVPKSIPIISPASAALTTLFDEKALTTLLFRVADFMLLFEAIYERKS
jgi:hypothetical protein